MSSGIETLDVFEPWLKATLETALVPALATTVINGQTKEDVEYPYVLMQFVSGRDILGVGTIRLDTDSIYMVKVIHHGNSFAPGRTVMAAIETAINGKNITTTSGNLTCIREASFHYPETIDGEQFMHVGGNYRVRAASD